MYVIRMLSAMLIPVLLVVFVACGTDMNDPEQVAVAFSEALAELDMEAAGEYATEESRELLEFQGHLMAEMSEDDREEILDEAPESFTVVESRVDGDSATVVLEDKTGQNEVDLAKVDGEWLVEYSK